MRSHFGRIQVWGGGLGRMGMALYANGAENEEKALGSEIGLGRWPWSKPYRCPLGSLSSLSTMLGLVLNFHQAVFLQRRSQGSAE